MVAGNVEQDEDSEGSLLRAVVQVALDAAALVEGSVGHRRREVRICSIWARMVAYRRAFSMARPATATAASDTSRCWWSASSWSITAKRRPHSTLGESAARSPFSRTRLSALGPIQRPGLRCAAAQGSWG